MRREQNGDLRLNLEDRLDLYRCPGGQRRKSKGTPRVEAISILAVQRVQQIGCAIDNQMLVGEIGSGVHTPQQLQHAKIVERTMRVVNGPEDLLSAILRCLVALLDRQVFSQDSLQVARMT